MVSARRRLDYEVGTKVPTSARDAADDEQAQLPCQHFLC